MRASSVSARCSAISGTVGKNVLGLVVELDCARVLGDLDLVGVAAETLTRGRLNVRLESAGDPRSRT
jgi:hypothetical protein